MNKATWIVLGMLLASTLSAIEIDRKAMKEKVNTPNSKDHPMLSRIPDSWIVQYEAKEFDELALIHGKSLAKDKFAKMERVEGKVTRIGYAFPEGRSTLEVIRQYQAALQKEGFQTLYTCSAKECGDAWFAVNWERLPGEEHACYFYGCDEKTIRYYVGKLNRPEGDIYVSLLAFIPVAHSKTPVAFLRVAEVKGMQEGLVQVTAAEMATGIQKEGHIAIYGIYFDFNKADIKSESEPTLQEMAKLLNQDRSMKVYIVGHTDNQGTLNYNMDLSQRRADAVIRALTQQHGIDGKRLIGKGVGPLSPVANNASDEGRAKNRRVELVQQ